MGMGSIGAFVLMQFFFQFHHFAALGLVFALHFIDSGNGVNSFFTFKGKVCSHEKNLL
jgi:hypothetical protein